MNDETNKYISNEIKSSGYIIERVSERVNERYTRIKKKEEETEMTNMKNITSHVEERRR